MLFFSIAELHCIVVRVKKQIIYLFIRHSLIFPQKLSIILCWVILGNCTWRQDTYKSRRRSEISVNSYLSHQWYLAVFDKFLLFVFQNVVKKAISPLFISPTFAVWVAVMKYSTQLGRLTVVMTPNSCSLTQHSTNSFLVCGSLQSKLEGIVERERGIWKTVYFSHSQIHCLSLFDVMVYTWSAKLTEEKIWCKKDFYGASFHPHTNCWNAIAWL